MCCEMIRKFDRFSFEKLIKENSAWFIQNADAIKGGISSLLALLAASQPELKFMQLLFGAGAGVGSYLIGSWIEFKIKKYAKK